MTIRQSMMRTHPRGKALVGALLFIAGLLLGAAGLLGAQWSGVLPTEKLLPQAKVEEKPVEEVKEEEQTLTQSQLEALADDLQKMQAQAEKSRQELSFEKRGVEQEKAALEVLKKEIDEKSKQIEDRLMTLVHAKDAAEEKNIKRLAKMWAQMEPASVFPLAKELGDETTSRIMYAMSDRQVGPILAAFSQNGEPGTKLATSVVKRLKDFMKPPANLTEASKPGNGP